MSERIHTSYWLETWDDPWHAAEAIAGEQSSDLIFAAGGGIFGHPSGVGAGVTALRQAWEATVDGVTLEKKAQRHPELQEALGFW